MKRFLCLILSLSLVLGTVWFAAAEEGEEEEDVQFSEEEMAGIPGICERVIQGLKDYSTIGPDRAMNFLNAKPKNSGEVV